jgi:hypothetical protein
MRIQHSASIMFPDSKSAYSDGGSKTALRTAKTALTQHRQHR